MSPLLVLSHDHNFRFIHNFSIFEKNNAYWKLICIIFLFYFLSFFPFSFLGSCFFFSLFSFFFFFSLSFLFFFSSLFSASVIFYFKNPLFRETSWYTKNKKSPEYEDFDFLSRGSQLLQNFKPIRLLFCIKSSCTDLN